MLRVNKTMTGRFSLPFRLPLNNEYNFGNHLNILSEDYIDRVMRCRMHLGFPCPVESTLCALPCKVRVRYNLVSFQGHVTMCVCSVH